MKGLLAIEKHKTSVFLRQALIKRFNRIKIVLANFKEIIKALTDSNVYFIPAKAMSGARKLALFAFRDGQRVNRFNTMKALCAGIAACRVLLNRRPTACCGVVHWSGKGSKALSSDCTYKI